MWVGVPRIGCGNSWGDAGMRKTEPRLGRLDAPVEVHRA